MARTRSSLPYVSDTPVLYVVGIDVGADRCAVCILRPDKTAVRSPFVFVKRILDQGGGRTFDHLSCS